MSFVISHSLSLTGSGPFTVPIPGNRDLSGNSPSVKRYHFAKLENQAGVATVIAFDRIPVLPTGNGVGGMVPSDQQSSVLPAYAAATAGDFDVLSVGVGATTISNPIMFAIPADAKLIYIVPNGGGYFVLHFGGML